MHMIHMLTNLNWTSESAPTPEEEKKGEKRKAGSVLTWQRFFLRDFRQRQLLDHLRLLVKQDHLLPQLTESKHPSTFSILYRSNVDPSVKKQTSK